MFDFEETFEEANSAFEEGDYAIAAFNSWLVNFAYDDEEFPYSYTQEMGRSASKKFHYLVRLYKGKILESEKYKEYKDALGHFPKYMRYFENYENDVRNLLVTEGNDCHQHAAGIQSEDILRPA